MHLVETVEKGERSVKKRTTQRIVVEKRKFDAVLSAMLNTKPVPREKIKTKGNRGPKKVLFPNPSKP